LSTRDCITAWSGRFSLVLSDLRYIAVPTTQERLQPKLNPGLLKNPHFLREKIACWQIHAKIPLVFKGIGYGRLYATNNEKQAQTD
jgi:hypothetical protein